MEKNLEVKGNKNLEVKGNILKLLRDGKEETIVLAGESGIGKTWMAKEISYRAIEGGLFDIILWAFLTKEYDTAIPPDNKALSERNALSESKVLLESMARQLSLLPIVEEYEVEQEDDVEAEEEKQADFEVKSEELQKKIAEKLVDRRVLLIVDVIVGSKLDEEQIVRGFKNLLPECIFKVLIARTQPVTQSTNVFELEPLSVDESMALLREKAGPVLGIPAIDDLAKLFIEKFKRLPSTISLLGRVFSNFGPDNDSVVQMLNTALAEASDNQNFNINRLLQSEYDLLPKSTRSVLMDCRWNGNHYFRECERVHYNELIAYWMVEGLLGHADSIEKAYEEGHRVLMELVDYQVLKNLDDGYVKMDATMLNRVECHCLGYCATPSLGLANVIDGEAEVFGKITQADGVMKTLCGREKGQKLSTLMLDGNGFCWEELLKSLHKELHVLALFNQKLESQSDHLLDSLLSDLNLCVLLLRGCVSQRNIDSSLRLRNLVVLEISGPGSLNKIPDEFFGDMPLIQSLNLSSLPIQSLPSSLYSLKKLVWLILRGCLHLEDLESLKAMDKLMVLDLSGSTSFNRFKDRTFLSNPRLQMLNFSNTNIRCIPLVKNLKELTHLLLSGCKEMERLRKMNTLSSLQVLDLSGSSIFHIFHDHQALENKNHLEIVDLSGTDIKQLPPDISDHRCLYLKGCKQLKELPFIEALKRLEVLDVSGTLSLDEIQENFFQKLEKLRIIKLSQTGIKSLPSLSNVFELRQLLLSNCSNLEGLPDLNSLEKLEVLDVAGCSALKVLEEKSFEKMTLLQTLNLSETKIEYLPSISSLSNLRKLLLRNCTKLKEVPPLDYQSKLEVLNLHAVRSFGISRTDFLKNMIHLVILDLSETSLNELPSLSTFTNLTQLSVAGCSLLKSAPDLESLTKIEVLDLSGTKITSLPLLDSFSKLRQLLLRDCSSLVEFINVKILDMFGVKAEELPYGISKLKNLERVHLPENKEIQVAEEDSNQNQYLWRIFNFLSTHLVSISSVRFLQLFNNDPSLWDTSFSMFRFCIEHVEGRYKIGNQHFNRNELVLLRDVYFQTSQFSRFEDKRTLEINGFQHPPKGLEDILNHTDCLYLVENTFERWLSNLGATNLKAMKGCWLKGCNKMKTVFLAEEKEEIALVGKTLESLAVSHATKLTSIYDGDVSAFEKLEDLYLDCCPELSVLFPLPQLPISLKVIHIKFCDKFETSFENCILPNLETLHLWELPKLKSIKCQFPSIKTLKICGCPLLVNVLSSPQSANGLETLEVSFCDKLTNLFENDSSMDNTLPSLKLMNLRELPELKSIACTLPSLHTLNVWGCPILVNVLSSPHPHGKLEILQVGYCDKLVTLFDHKASTDYNLPSVKTLHLQELPKLRKFGARMPSAGQDTIITGCPNAEKPVAQT
ncbi:hypothetical protein LguiB_033542 [Lonicera macranthoides]